MHGVPAGQRLPHVPQLFGSVAASTHDVPHCVRGGMHTTTTVHVPAAQLLPVGHTFPHEPQLLLSTCVSAQNRLVPASPVLEPMHVVSPVAQSSEHAPAEHTWPAGQARPHMPQLNRSVAVIVHSPPHATCGEGHTSAHAPIAQDCPAAHACPHVPQWSLSF